MHDRGTCMVGGMHNREHAWHGVCMAGGHVWWGGGMCSRGRHAWMGACMVGGMHGKGDVAGGMHGRGACVAGEMCMAGGCGWQGGIRGRRACMVGGMHGREGVHGRGCACHTCPPVNRMTDRHV